MTRAEIEAILAGTSSVTPGPWTVRWLCTALLESMDRVEELEGALEPFSEALDLISHVSDEMSAGSWVITDKREAAMIPRVKHFRAARKSLGGSNAR